MARRATISLSALLVIAAVAIAQCIALRLWYPDHGMSGFVLLAVTIVPTFLHFAALGALRMQARPLHSGVRVLAAVILGALPVGGCITWLLNVYGS